MDLRCRGRHADAPPPKARIAVGLSVTDTEVSTAHRQECEQQMTGEVQRWLPPKHRAPIAPKLSDVEVAQSCNLAVDFRGVWRRRTDPYARHGRSGCGAISPRRIRTGANTTRNPVHPSAFNLLGDEVKFKALAHNAGKKASN